MNDLNFGHYFPDKANRILFQRVSQMTLPHVPSLEDIGFLMLRLAIADPAFFLYMSQKAEHLSEAMLPGDKEMLRTWCWFVSTQREGLRKAGILNDDEE